MKFISNHPILAFYWFGVAMLCLANLHAAFGFIGVFAIVVGVGYACRYLIEKFLR